MSRALRTEKIPTQICDRVCEWVSLGGGGGEDKKLIPPSPKNTPNFLLLSLDFLVSLALVFRKNKYPFC